MANFLTEIGHMVGFDSGIGGYRYTVFSSGSVYVEGYRAVIAFDEQEVIVRAGKSSIKISGESLMIELLNPGELIVKGKIRSVEELPS